ncbi:hypothetical protein SDC9_95597 [bioreactor metagenome]|uniref:Uncharacterized protein n=1 Tax=bioreactor metagenome TaxID=1076179 RepID=A0A645A6S0_9ZZZZ
MLSIFVSIPKGSPGKGEQVAVARTRNKRSADACRAEAYKTCEGEALFLFKRFEIDFQILMTSFKLSKLCLHHCLTSYVNVYLQKCKQCKHTLQYNVST